MLCEKCQRNVATVRYAEVVDRKVKEVHLCSDCLAEHERSADVGFELTRPKGVPKRDVAQGLRRPESPEERCASCGQALASVLESGSMGCSICYETFAKDIESVLEGLHAGVRHRGKAPHVDDVRAHVWTDLQSKRSLLRSALRTENYEEAAHLRDEIRVLEAELNAAEKEN